MLERSAQNPSEKEPMDSGPYIKLKKRRGWGWGLGLHTMHYKTCYTVQIVYITERGGVPASAGMRLTLSHDHAPYDNCLFIRIEYHEHESET